MIIYDTWVERKPLSKKFLDILSLLSSHIIDYTDEIKTLMPDRIEEIRRMVAQEEHNEDEFGPFIPS